MNVDEQAVASVLQHYNDILNASDTDAVMKIYAPDGIFMAQGSPSSIGTHAVRAAYERVFAAITLTVTFTLAECVQVAPDWVMARTNSAGTTKIHATGETTNEANQELFLFQKLQGTWKIARYCFATTNPPKA